MPRISRHHSNSAFGALRRIALFAHARSTAAGSGLDRTLANLIWLYALRILRGKGCVHCSDEDHQLSRCLERLAQDFARFSPVVSGILPAPEFDGELFRVISDLSGNLFLSDECALGYLYQFFCGPMREKSQRAIATADKHLKKNELISFTQLYTPAWVVDFLVQNTLLPQWRKVENDHLSWQYLLAGSTSSSQRTAGELTLMDPACGSGHFLLRAADCFLAMHEAEGKRPRDAFAFVLSNQLFGADIDEKAVWVCHLAFFVKYLGHGGRPDQAIDLPVVPLSAADDLLGSLGTFAGTHVLNRRYAAVVMNPPYTGRKLLDRELKSLMKGQFPSAHQDLCVAFMHKGFDLLQDGGLLGAIMQSSILALPTYKDFRQYLLERRGILFVGDLGPGVFPLQGGEKVDSALMVARKEACSLDKSCFMDLTKSQDKPADLLRNLSDLKSAGVASNCTLVRSSIFRMMPQHAISPSCPEAALKFMAGLPQLDSIADVRQGLATTDNKRFVRYWWAVPEEDLELSWFPYVKGAGRERWHAPIRHVVYWADNGQAIKELVKRKYPYLGGKAAWVVKNEQYYFRRGLTFSFVNSSHFSVRLLPSGCIFDVSGSAIFAADELTEYFLLAYLNSSFVRASASLINPTINFQVGDIRRLPLLPFSRRQQEELACLARECIELKRYACCMDATGWRWSRTTFPAQSAQQAYEEYAAAMRVIASRLPELEAEINHIVGAAMRPLAASPSAARELFGWIEAQGEVRTQISMLSGRDFAKALLIKRLFALVISEQSPICDASIILSGDLDLAWLSQQLGMPVMEYFSRQINKDIQKTFFNRAPFAVRADAESRVFLTSLREPSRNHS